jgi:hypothetical protein
MVREPSRHGRRRLLCIGQTLMGRAKVLDCTHHEHPLVQRPGVAGQCPATASSVANYRKQDSLDSQAVDFPIHDVRILPRKGNFATEPLNDHRPSRDYERLTTNSAAMIQISMIRLLLNRLA